MSEKRKPELTMLLKNKGKKKTNKVEIFSAEQFFNPIWNARITNQPHKRVRSTYRIRVNGRWYPKGEKKYYWKTELLNLIFASIKL